MLYFITGNKNKYIEAKEVVSEMEQLDIDLPEIQESDAKEVIKFKLQEAQKHQQSELVVEDISLHLDCLNGLPGPLIKWFIRAMGVKGIADMAEKLGQTSAQAKALLGYSKDGEIYFFEALVKGQIVQPRGEYGFGWDPIFQPEGFNKTYAEVPTEEKVKIKMEKPRHLVFKELKKFRDGKS